MEQQTAQPEAWTASRRIAAENEVREEAERGEIESRLRDALKPYGIDARVDAARRVTLIIGQLELLIELTSDDDYDILKVAGVGVEKTPHGF